MKRLSSEVRPSAFALALGYHCKREQRFVDTKEWEEVRVGKSLPNDRLMAEFLSYVYPSFGYKITGV